MLTFHKITGSDLTGLAPYFAAQKTHISDYSLGFQFMWGESLQVDYCFAAGCLILHEFYAGSHYFYYPLCVSGDEAAEGAALDAVEAYCRDENIRLHFTNIPRAKLPAMLDRYGQDCALNNRRRWRDYLYEAEDFRTFAGKRYSGQRNHINKFKKTYPMWQFRPYTEAEEPALSAFLREYAEGQRAKGMRLADEEMAETLALVPRMRELNLFGGILTVDGKIVGFSAGERCGDMTVIHIEKALKEFEGAYPMLAQQFARTFCGDGVRFLNRMDDAGDIGLRKSKLQYLPCEVVGKYNVLPRRAIDALSRVPEIRTERLSLHELAGEDAGEFYRLCYDGGRNRYWGYDWREDFPEGEPPEEYFLETARERFHKKEEVSMGIYADGRLLGEAVLHRFGYRENVELGVRLLPEAEGKGYAREAMHAMAEYAFLHLGIERAEAKCFRENARSEKMLRAAGFLPCGEDGTFLYFYKTAGV